MSTHEKQAPRSSLSSTPLDQSSGDVESVDATAIDPTATTTKLQRLCNRLDAATGVEARGIERVPDALRNRKISTRDYVNMGLVWLSINCTANNMTVGIIGPSLYGLGLVDAIV